MKYMGAMTSDYDLVNKKYVDSKLSTEIFEYDGTSPYNPTWGFDDIGNAVSNSHIPIVIWGYEVYYYGYAGSDPDDGDYYQFINQVQTPYSNNTGIIYYLTVWEGGSFDVGSTTALYSDTNTRVTQTVRTNDANYPLLLAPSGQTATTTTTANFATAATYNPSTGILSVKQKVLAGTTSDTTENWIQVASKSGQIYLDSVGNSGGTGTRGIWVGAHGTATSGKWALEVDTNNVVKLNGDITGNAATATTATSATSATNADNAAAVVPQLNNPTSSSTRYIPFFSGTSGNRIPYVNNGLEYLTLEGTTSANGYGCLILGNSTASGTAGNKFGAIRIYNSGAYYTELRSTAVTANRTLNLPLITATGYLLGKSSTSAIGASNQLVYFSASGVASAGIKISGGTADPSGGSSGDIYIQYSA